MNINTQLKLINCVLIELMFEDEETLIIKFKTLCKNFPILKKKILLLQFFTISSSFVYVIDFHIFLKYQEFFPYQDRFDHNIQ